MWNCILTVSTKRKHQSQFQLDLNYCTLQILDGSTILHSKFEVLKGNNMQCQLHKSLEIFATRLWWHRSCVEKILQVRHKLNQNFEHNASCNVSIDWDLCKTPCVVSRYQSVELAFYSRQPMVTHFFRNLKMLIWFFLGFIF